MTRMMRSSGRPTLPSMAFPFGCRRPSDSTTFGLIVALALPLALHAERRGASPVNQAQYTSGVNVVEVYAAVLDRDGKPVTGLPRDAFTVLEDGQPQAIGTFAEADFPLSVAIAIDRSFSMKGAQLTNAIDGARAFLTELRPADQAMVIGIGSEVETLAPLSPDRSAQEQAIDALKPWGTTELHDAVIQSIDAIQSARGRRALLLLSDGNDRYSTASAADAIERARRSDVMVYPFALGSTRPPLFAELAVLTGGRSFYARTPQQVTDGTRAVANELRHQYLVGYTPARPPQRGENRWRSIVVRVNRPDVTVRARDGYFVN
jgi:Ca-activated chloride channel family protein